jgi:uncharacterized membrane protein YbhN (UPF0104 family)
MPPLRLALLLLLASLLGIALTGTALLAALEGFEATGHRLETLNGLALFGSWAIWACTVIPQGQRWSALLPSPQAPGPWRLSGVLMGSNLLNLALPGPVGELGAAWFLRRRYGVPLALALASTLLGRVLALLVFVTVTLLCWPFLSVPETTARWLQPLCLLLFLGGLALLPLLIAPQWLLHTLSRVLSALPFGQRFLPRIRWWLDCFSQLGHLGPRRWLRALGWSLVNTLLLGCSGYLCFSASGASVSLLGSVFIQSLTAVASVAAILIPSGLGAVDITFVGAFPAIAQGNLGDAVLCATTLRLIQIATLFCGVPAVPILLAQLVTQPGATVAQLQSELLRSEI